jgi:uncharacterized damage-inducible protein DinB
MLAVMSEPASEELPQRQFGWLDMWVGPDEDPRDESAAEGERATLVMYLRNRRLTLEMKCAGLDAVDMARRSVPPSDLSLLGLVRHLASVEQFWFRRVLAGQPGPQLYRGDSGEHLDFDEAVADPDVVAEAWAAWRTEVTFAEQLVDATADLGATGTFDPAPGQDGTISVREVMVHMIEEYARHLGHADLLRERIDGRVGQ